ncbi:MAG: tellurite resistance TerB family protein [Kiloniellales bacterium]|nr:tellurite resistance TerB family protein [Kiloniellales bacterium]
MADTHSALIYTMVLVSAADRNMTDSELKSMGEIVSYLPVFRGYDPDSLPKTAKACAELLGDDKGLDKALDIIVDSVPERLRETAYAIACDVAAADGKATQEELRLLEMLRHRLQVGRLAAAAIERGSRARHQTL